MVFIYASSRDGLRSLFVRPVGMAYGLYLRKALQNNYLDGVLYK